MILALRDGSKTMTRRNLGPKGPRFKAGDMIWVREAAYISPAHFCAPHDATCFDYDGAPRVVSYFADHGVSETAEDYGVKLRSPRFMPKWASRITLVVTESRVERLQDISIADALAEGIRCPDCGYTLRDAQVHMDHGICVNKWLMECKAGESRQHGAIEAFKVLWESIHGPGSWDENPEVEVISFEVQK